MIGLHGGASESLRDSALQLIAVAFQALGGRWAIEGEASSTPKGLRYPSHIFESRK
jgi:hypothetical protein